MIGRANIDGTNVSQRCINAQTRPLESGYYPKPLIMEVRASQIRRCRPGGRLVYTRFTVREQVRPGGPMGKWSAWTSNMCGGFR